MAGVTYTVRGRGLTLAQRDEIRIPRLLESKVREIGIDTQALGQSVNEHKLAAQAAAQAKAAEYPLAVQRQMSTLRAADTLRAQQDAARAAALRETVSAWGNQTKETRREWPIQDPTALSREQLPRSVEPVYETQRPSSVSGCQTFGGEWREDPRLKQAARAELRTGLATGRFENSQKRAAQQDDKAAAAAAQRTMYAAVTTMAAAAEREAAWAKRNMVVENATLADTVRATAAAQTAKEEALKTAHVQIQEANPMLREDTRQGLFVNAPHRYRSDHYRGMLKSELENIRDVQAAQRREAEERREAAAAAQQREAQLAATYQQKALALAAAAEAHKAADMQRYYAELRAQAEAQAAQRARQRAEERRALRPWNGGLLAKFGRTLR